MSTNLATFVDRFTMRHVRVYPHSIDRVWKALTDEQHLAQWVGFPVHCDLRPGGRCVWGHEPNQFFETEIGRFEPKTVIEHLQPEQTADDRGYMLFELTEVDEGTRFDFTQHFPRDFEQAYEPDRLGADLPGGPDTPWRPGFVGGFHGMFDNLGDFLDGVAPGDPKPKDPLFTKLVSEWLWRKTVAGELTEVVADRYRRELRGVAHWNDMNEVYREHIRKTIPKR